ncbi:hypothetical protein TXYLGN1_29290 [Tepidimicrobium xylanilyticum]
MGCRGDLWSPVYDYNKLLLNDIMYIGSIKCDIGIILRWMVVIWMNYHEVDLCQ